MNQIDPSETPKETNHVATETNTPQLTLKEFNEINYATLHTLGVHYFAEILKENERLKQTRFLCTWDDTISSLVKHRRIVVADSPKKAIEKLLLNCDETFQVIFNEYYCFKYSAQNYPEIENMFNRLITLKLLDDDNHDNFDHEENNPERAKKYKEFITEYLDYVVDLFDHIVDLDHRSFSIEKIDDKMLIE